MGQLLHNLLACTPQPHVREHGPQLEVIDSVKERKIYSTGYFDLFS